MANAEKKPVMSGGVNKLGKRQLVERAEKNVFLWVAGASVIVVICAIAAIFLGRQLLFNQKIISHRNETAKTLKNNVTNMKQLSSELQKLLANSDLLSAKSRPDETSLEVVFDALPTTGDSATLSNSLLTHIVTPASINIDALTAGTSGEVAAADPTAMAGTPASGTGSTPAPQALPFTVSATGGIPNTKQLLLNLERSIRPMKITQLRIQAAQDGQLSTRINGETYYLSRDLIELYKETVKAPL